VTELEVYKRDPARGQMSFYEPGRRAQGPVPTCSAGLVLMKINCVSVCPCVSASVM